MTKSAVLADLRARAKKAAQARGKDLAWLQYAKRTKTGAYRFLSHKQIQWRVLEEVAASAAKDYPEYSTGQLVDWLAEIVNQVK